MRQSMAFNLEFKITYDELSPSLQDMFKSLQGQITDNRNEITDINMDITDISNEITEINNEINTINNHLTQIDNSITNINENIQNIENDITNIEGDITDLGDQITEINNNITIINDKLEEVDPDTISNLDFLNLAPKIGYYQDDTVEVISKYNCNNLPENTYNYPAPYAITTDNMGREIIYFAANDGSYEQLIRDDQWNLFKATRSNDQDNFLYNNIPLIPSCFEGETFNVSRVLSADNDYILLALKPDTGSVLTNNRYNDNGWIILTNNSSDPKDWTEKIDLSFIDFKFIYSANSQHCILVRYFKNKQKLVVVRVVSRPGNFGDFEVWDIKTKTKKYSTIIPLATDRVRLDDPYSFNSSRKIQVYSEAYGNAWNIEGWRKTGCLYLYDQELLRFNWFPVIAIANMDTKTMTTWYAKPSFIFKVPKSIVDSYTGTITCLNSTTNRNDGLFYYGDDVNDVTNADMNVISCNMTSYDTQNGRFYWYGAIDRDQVNVEAQRFYNADQAEGVPTKVKYRGEYISPNNSNYYKLHNITPLDSSLWGKGWKSNVFTENMAYLCGRSKTNSGSSIIENPVIINSFQKYKNAPGDNSILIVEPKPGNYRLGNKFVDYYRMTFNVTSDTTAILLRINNDNSHPVIHRYTTIPFNEDSKDQFIVSVYKSYPNINWNDLTITGYENYINLSVIFYNYFEDITITLLQYPNTTGSPWRMCFGLKIYSLKENRLIHFFTPEELNNKVPGYKDFVTYNTSTYPNDMVYYRTSASIWLNSTKLLLPIYCENMSRNASFTRNLMLQFNATFTDITDSAIITGGNQVLGLPYIGYNCLQWTNWGLVFMSASYSGYLMINTQKPLISGYGDKNYPTDEIITDFSKTNQYYLYCQSAQGLVCYIPTINIFLGGYYTVIANPIEVVLQANTNNYIYLERGEDRDTINAYATTTNLYYEGQRLFNKICVARCTTDSANITDVEYYRINIGYNDYVWNG